MTDPAAESATAVAADKVVNIATFVFDSTLPREAFLRLVQTNDGLIPKLVRRLMEKHGSGDGVSRGLLECCWRDRPPELTYSSC